MKITIACSAAFLLATSSISYSQSGYVSGQPSIDCTKLYNTVALILCREPKAAQADWNLNSAIWALKFTTNDTQRPRLERDQQEWRESLDQICALPRFQTSEDQAGRAMAEAFGKVILGSGMRMPGPQPITQAHVNCLLNAYHARAALLRSKLTGDALSESQLSPEQHAQLQGALAEKGFLRPDQFGPGTHDGEFGPITRKAIKQFQQSLGASQSGFLSDDQRSALLERPGDREAVAAKIAAVAKARQDALDAQAAEAARQRERDEAVAQAKQDAKNKRLEAEAAAAREWREKIDEARSKGGQYADRSEFKWSLSEVDNPMIDDKDYTVASAQLNGRGAIARVEGSCPKPGLVTFVAELHDISGSPLALPDFAAGYIAGNKRINDDPLFPVRFAMQKFRNRILVSTLLSLAPVESIETTWRVLAEVETGRGRVVIQIPMFNANVQKLLVACGKQYEDTIKRRGHSDAPNRQL